MFEAEVVRVARLDVGMVAIVEGVGYLALVVVATLVDVVDWVEVQEVHHQRPILGNEGTSANARAK